MSQVGYARLAENLLIPGLPSFGQHELRVVTFWERHNLAGRGAEITLKSGVRAREDTPTDEAGSFFDVQTQT